VEHPRKVNHREKVEVVDTTDRVDDVLHDVHGGDHGVPDGAEGEEVAKGRVDNKKVVEALLPWLLATCLAFLTEALALLRRLLC